MDEPTKQGVNISGGDKAVDRSQTAVDNSSRATTTSDDHAVRSRSVDDHSVRTTTVTDNSSRVVNLHANDNRRKSNVSISGGTLAALAALVVVAVLVMWLIPRGGVAPPSPASTAPAVSAAKQAIVAPPSVEVKPPAPKQAKVAPPITAAPAPPRQTAESSADFLDVEASGQPQEGLTAGSREAYGDATDTAMLLAKAHFLAWRRGEITHVREIEGIKTLRADTMLVAKGQVRGGRMIARSSIEEFQKTGIVHIKVRFSESADATPNMER